MDIKKRASGTQLHSRLSFPNLSEEGIEVVCCYLEDEENATHKINAALSLKESGKIVLSIGLLPFSFENKETILASLKRAQLLQRASDGCILFNQDAFREGECTSEEVGNNYRVYDR